MSELVPTDEDAIRETEEFEALVGIHAGDSFPSEQALLGHMLALPGFTIGGTPGTDDPMQGLHPGVYWVQLRRDTDGAACAVGFKADADGVYRAVLLLRMAV
jgi:hypothetical protein